MTIGYWQSPDRKADYIDKGSMFNIQPAVAKAMAGKLLNFYRQSALGGFIPLERKFIANAIII